MKALLVVALLLVTGCAAVAYEDKEAKILDSLSEPTMQYNPSLLLAQCYSLSDVTKRTCYEEYVRVSERLGDPIDPKACSRLGLDCS